MTTFDHCWTFMKILRRPLLVKYLRIKIDSLGLADGDVFEFATTPSLLTLESQREWHEVGRIKKLFIPNGASGWSWCCQPFWRLSFIKASESSGIHLCFFISTPNITTPSLSFLASCRLQEGFAVTMQSFHRVANDWKSFSTKGRNRKAPFSLCREDSRKRESLSAEWTDNVLKDLEVNFNILHVIYVFQILKTDYCAELQEILFFNEFDVMCTWTFS